MSSLEALPRPRSGDALSRRAAQVRWMLLWTGTGLALFGGAALILNGAGKLSAAPAAAWHSLVPAALFYVAAHFVRAARLAVIAMTAMGLRFRSGLALHFCIAPWSLVLPFKLDEFIRLFALVQAGRAPYRALTALLLDRSMDGAILLALALYGLGRGSDIPLSIVAALCGAVGSVIFAFGFAPALLEALQRHIFLNHSGKHPILALASISKLRRALIFGGRCMRQVLPLVVVSTVLVWMLEIAAIHMLLETGPAPGPDIIEAALRQPWTMWQSLFGAAQPEGLAGLSPFIFLTLLLALWPWAAWLYWRNIPSEPARSPYAPGSSSP